MKTLPKTAAELRQEALGALQASASDPLKKFQELSRLYINHPQGTHALKRFINSAGYTPTNLKNLEYELQKLFSITDAELKSKRKVAVIGVVGSEELVPTLLERLQAIDFEAERGILITKVNELPEISGIKEMLPAPLPEFSKGLPGIAERKEWLKSKNKETKSRSIADLDAEIADTIDVLTETAYTNGISNLKNRLESELEYLQELKDIAKNKVHEFFDQAPEDAKAGIKFRDEFPFLKEADCPNKLKILVADKITAYENLVDGRAELKEAIEKGLTNDEIFEIAKKTVENFELNLQIYDELNFYKEHKQVLGKHPIFEDEILQEKIDAMTDIELVKHQKNLRSYISKDKKTMDKLKEGEAKDEFMAKHNFWLKELALVDAKLEPKK